MHHETHCEPGAVAPSDYDQLCSFMDVIPLQAPIDVAEFASFEVMAAKSTDERFSAALQVFVDMALQESYDVNVVDKVLIDHYIALIDQKLAQQLDEILHHPQFQRLESSWCGLEYLINHTDYSANIKIELLDVSQDDLVEDFSAAVALDQTGLYQHVYSQEYDTPGGEPISAMVGDYTFNANNPDISLLNNIAAVAAAAHCPFIAAAGAELFHKKTFHEVVMLDDMTTHMERAEYIRWNRFRESENARYVGLTLPRFLLRIPYGDECPVRHFVYREQVQGQTAEHYLWGNACFAFAANMTRCFKQHGWTVNIRGPEAGGKVANLPLHYYEQGRGLQNKIPTEVLIPETRELELANLGFMPLSYYKNSDHACFFSANSLHQPAMYSEPEATATSRINARLPYILLSSRIAHYLKVMQREVIGLSVSRAELEQRLNRWLQTLVTKMNRPSAELAATHPLQSANVEVIECDDNPGFYRIKLFIVPHFQIEGIDVKLSLVGQLPKC